MPSYIVGGKASAAGLLAAEEAFERNATHMSPLQKALHEPAWKGGAAPGEEGTPPTPSFFGLSRFSFGAPVVLEASKLSGLARRDRR